MSLYVFSTDDGHHKIGVAKNAGNRLKGVQTGNHRPVTIAKVMDTRSLDIDPYQVEWVAHKKLDDFCSQGEWFFAPLLTIMAAIEEAIFDLVCGVPAVGPAPQPKRRGRPANGFDKKAHDRQKAAERRAKAKVTT